VGKKELFKVIEFYIEIICLEYIEHDKQFSQELKKLFLIKIIQFN